MLLVNGDAGLHTFRSFAFLRQDKAERALLDAQHAINIDPRSSHAHYRAGRALNSRGRHTEAGEALCKGFNLTPREAKFTQVAPKLTVN